MSDLKRVALFLVAGTVLLPTFAGASPEPAEPPGGDLVEVVVTLDEPPGPGEEQRLQEAIPGVAVQRRYSLTVDGLAVVLPRGELSRLQKVQGVLKVYPSVAYRAQRSSTPGFIGAPSLWGPTLSTAGNGMKIGIIDDGIDRTHPYFSPRGYRMPRGFPKGARAFTSAKVIVARAFAPRKPTWRYARRPFDPLLSEHATHVAGIAAGNYRTLARGQRISGVAPKAYLGNYKVLTIPTPGLGPNGNSPEIVAGIEAAVRDGMDVINLSLGEAEIEPGRDIVAKALDGAAARGVIPVVAAGNDFEEFGAGSITSPGNSSRAISAAAESEEGPTIASFSSSGPTPLSLRMKPDVTAPGVSVLSSVPRRVGLWAEFSGTSMAAPHVAGAAALLKQRHPTWTVDQLKSTLVQTGDPVHLGSPVEAVTTREGGGTVNLVRANTPLLFASPTGLSFGLVTPGQVSPLQRVSLADAGGGAGPPWAVTVEPQDPPAGASVTAPTTASVPGEIVVSASAALGATQVDHTGFIVLSRFQDRRRIPYWFRVAAPALGTEPNTPLTRTGTYHGDTRGRPALVDSYRYPEDPRELGLTRFLRGPEQVFRVSLRSPVANFGVAVTVGGSIQPRVVRAGNENQLIGQIGLPFNANPYLPGFQGPKPVAGAALPGAGDYDIVFDSATTAGAEPFTFRFWIADTTAPRARLLSTRGGLVRISARDDGAGIDPTTIRVWIDGRRRAARYNAGKHLVTASIRNLRRGRHRLQFRVSDYQESKNMENVRRILPNTRSFRTAFIVR